MTVQEARQIAQADPETWRSDPYVRATLEMLAEEWLTENPARDDEAWGEVVYTLLETREALRRERAALAEARRELAESSLGNDRLLNVLRGTKARLRQHRRALRRELWLNHGCSVTSLYGDDGEMQCANGLPYHPPLDFKRQPIEEIIGAVSDARLARTALAYPGPSRRHLTLNLKESDDAASRS